MTADVLARAIIAYLPLMTTVAIFDQNPGKHELGHMVPMALNENSLHLCHVLGDIYQSAGTQASGNFLTY